MFVPSMYHSHDPAITIRVIRDNPMAIVVGGAGGDLYAIHAPVILEDPDHVETRADLVGASFIGHMNCTNDHYAFLGAGGSALLVFQGPQAYISPSYHGASPAAPTWNFITVHVRGHVEMIDRRKPAIEVVTATVRELERRDGVGHDRVPVVLRPNRAWCRCFPASRRIRAGHVQAQPRATSGDTPGHLPLAGRAPTMHAPTAVGRHAGSQRRGYRCVPVR
ncbi:MAG: hypothetical protein CSB46_00485 [Micrococcales bacterium]|nr:MAG: hypothetical protein CSB46_00485 [Micrococcales bacterium]